jgi:hypothetical protein
MFFNIKEDRGSGKPVDKKANIRTGSGSDWVALASKIAI